MFEFNLTSSLKKELKKLSKKDKILFEIFKKKLTEIINRDKNSINSYKNLKRPLNKYKRIHLDDKFILIFKVDLKDNHILFIKIVHWDEAY